MMAVIHFKTSRVQDEWERGQLDSRLKTVVRDLALEMGGVRLTMIVRRDDEIEAYVALGGARNTKHRLVNGRAQAVDLTPPAEETDPGQWYERAKAYLDSHYRGLHVIIRPHGTGPHLHGEVEGSEIQIVMC
jgi:hypothetical protein